MPKINVGIIIGSDSDIPIAEEAKKVLEKFNILIAATIRSAHRTPYDLEPTVKDWENRFCQVFIVIAGMAAHLAGAVAALTIRPVIAVPVAGQTATAVNGLDALLSCVQMPTGVPVATVAINGAANAALLAIQIMAINAPLIQESLNAYRNDLASKTLAKAAALKQAGWPD